MGIDNKIRINDGEELELIHDRLDALLVHDPSLEHLLHCELPYLLTLELISLYPPDLAEASSANRVLILKELFVES